MTVRFCLVALFLAGTAARAQPPVEATLGAIDAAFAAHDLDKVLAAYDPSATELVGRTRAQIQGWLALTDARLNHRVARVTGNEAVVLRRLTFTDHGRPQIDLVWETLAVKNGRVVASGERRYARTANLDLAIELAPEAGTLKGTARLDVEVTEAGEDNLIVGLNRGIEVTSLTDEKDRPLRFERTADTIEIPSALRAGERRSLRVAFGGKLFNEAKEQGYSQVSISPAGSFASWVTSFYPHLVGSGASKAKGRITYDVPEGITVASSGRLAKRTTAAGRTREVFTVDRPLDFSFAAAKYFVREATIDGAHLGIYLLTGGEAKAALYMKEVAELLRCERALYGAYPFDGYAVVEIPSSETGTLGGSSEQGMNLFPAGMLPDAEVPLLLLGHEIGHSWWGNLVGSDDGPLLDEGLAQISAVMCYREAKGDAAARQYMKWGVPAYPQSAAMYFARFAGPGKDVPLGIPPSGSDAAAALHDLADTKGMFVYEMLRERIGQAAFAGGLRAAAKKYAGRSMKLAELRAEWEAASGKDLRTFFAQWFERTGVPELVLESKTEPAGAHFTVTGTIAQVGDVYDADVEVGIQTGGGQLTKVVTLAGKSTPFSFTVDTKPTSVEVDPDYKLLRWTPMIREKLSKMH